VSISPNTDVNSEEDTNVIHSLTHHSERGIKRQSMKTTRTMNNTHPVLKCLLNERDKQHQGQRDDICHWINRTEPSKKLLKYNVYAY